MILRYVRRHCGNQRELGIAVTKKNSAALKAQYLCAGGPHFSTVTTRALCLSESVE